ncbi:hypothetical protein [Salmonella phage F115]|uniref:Uncharacterized protein n=1 Tax=Salmonella phage F61 TaxID=2982033 RepID=A0A977R8R7_9CAUD|nr:hypothetical protein [Salmonella phage F115]UXM05390.1 hypothetical protein [Salmonella phage F61]
MVSAQNREHVNMKNTTNKIIRLCSDFVVNVYFERMQNKKNM